MFSPHYLLLNTGEVNVKLPNTYTLSKQILDTLLQQTGLLLHYQLQIEPVGNEEPPELFKTKQSKVRLVSTLDRAASTYYFNNRTTISC